MAKQLSLQVCIIIMMILFLMFAGLSLVDMECLVMARGGLFCMFLLAMAVIDFRTGLLPDKGNLYLAALGLVMAAIVGSLRDALLGALLGAALLFALRTLSRGGIGLGDVKYAAPSASGSAGRGHYWLSCWPLLSGPAWRSSCSALGGWAVGTGWLLARSCRRGHT